MFARPRPKKSALGGGPPPKKRKAAHAVEEIKFDPDARNEYLTGFHKRKVQRTKRAQEEAAKRARQEKIDLRKQVRTYAWEEKEGGVVKGLRIRVGIGIEGGRGLTTCSPVSYITMTTRARRLGTYGHTHKLTH